MAFILRLPPEACSESLNVFMQELGLPKEYGFFDLENADRCTTSRLIAVTAAMQGEKNIHSPNEVADTEAPNLYFMKMPLSTGTGRAAVIQAIANNLDNISLPNCILKTFIDSTIGETPDKRGQLLLANKDIQKAHKKAMDVMVGDFPRTALSQIAESFGSASEVHREDDATDHDGSEEHIALYCFMTFIVKNNKLYELDPNNERPICHGPCTREALLQSSLKIISEHSQRMTNSPDNYIAIGLTGGCEG